MTPARRILAGWMLAFAMTALVLLAATPTHASPADDRWSNVDLSGAQTSDAPAVVAASPSLVGDQTTPAQLFPFTHMDVSVFVVGAIGMVLFALVTPHVLLRRLGHEFIIPPAAVCRQMQETGVTV